MNVMNYKCPCCGSALGFDSQQQQMHCPNCGNSFDVAAINQYADAVASEQQGSDMSWEQYGPTSGSGDWQPGEGDNLNVYTCPSCGAEIMADANTAATTCVYCGNHTLLASRMEGVFKPDIIIPFHIRKERAEQELRKFCKGKPLLPRNFATDNHIQEIKGVYVPFWLFDCGAQGSMTFNATRSRSWRSGDYQYTETSHYLVSRDGSAAFQNVPVDGSTKADDTYMEAIEPFDYGGAEPFVPAYLSGYLADKYDQTAEQVQGRANERITTSIAALLRSTVSGYGTVTTRSSNVRLQKGRVRYALMPVWMLNTQYEGKTYTFALNGQTGRFVGQLPYSKGRYWAWVLGITGAVTLIGALIALLG